MEKKKEITLDINNPDSIYNWITFKIKSPTFRNIIKDFIDENCSLFIDIEENTFQQGELFNEFTQLIENLLTDLLKEGGISQEQFLSAAEKGLEDKKYKKYFEQLLKFSDYNYFKNLMTKRNYQLIKRVEEQMEQKKKENDIKKLEKVDIRKENQKKGNKKSEREIEEEKQRILLMQFLNQEEERELQQAIQRSFQSEEDKRKLSTIEDEEIKRAIKLSLLDSVKTTSSNIEKKEEQKKENFEIKEESPQPKKQEFIIEKKDMINYETKETPNIPSSSPVIKTENNNNIISRITNFQFSGNTPTEEKPNKQINIISAQNSFEFQIESKKNGFGISKNNPFNSSNYRNPYVPPPPEETFKIPEKSSFHINQQLIDDEPEEKKDSKPPIYMEIKSKIQDEEKDEIKEEEKSQNKKSFNLLQFEENPKEENIIVAKEIKIKSQNDSDIIKNILKENKFNDKNGKNDDKGGLLIDDYNEEDIKNYKSNEPKTNTFIDKEKDLNLGKVKRGKEGGDFLNYFTGKKKYEIGGMEKMENKIKESKFQSVINQNEEEDEDYQNKLREVEKEKQAKLKEYRELLLKMTKDKRENKAKKVLSPEELAKLESKKRLAEQLKAKRK